MAGSTVPTGPGEDSVVRDDAVRAAVPQVRTSGEEWSVVALGAEGPRDARDRALELLADVSDVDGALAVAAQLPATLRPGGDGTVAVWELLATVASRDLGLARAIEPHLDALAILAQAGLAPDDVVTDGARASWGVFAAEGPAATLAAQASDDGRVVLLDGTKPWCSLADRLDAALVTARDAAGERQLYAVDLRHAGVGAAAEEWVARGLTEIPSTGLELTAVPAVAVGEPGWYLERPGFAWGGAGVAACWYGGAVGLARTLREQVERRSDAELLLMHLGDVDEHLHAARAVLGEAAREVAAGRPTPVTTARVRAVLARTCERVLRTAAHALGPAPLALDAAHAKRVADLEIYVRQHHAERDLVSLGRKNLATGPSW